MKFRNLYTWTLAMGAALAVSCGQQGNTEPNTTTASIIAELDKAAIDKQLITRFFVVGYAHGLGNQFFDAAVSKARKLKEAYPNDQFVFLRNRETGQASDLSEVKSFGVKVVSFDNSKLQSSTLLNTLDTFPRIRSLDFFAHSGAHSGIGLESGDGENRFGMRTPELAKLKDNFVNGAFVSINGCNSALTLAPFLSKVWGVPVSGSLTSTDFQQLHTDKFWYFNNPGQFPPGGWAKSNPSSYLVPKDCAQGGCYRMKPDNHPYNGSWGDFKAGGLSFYKTFCNYDGDQNECLKAMAKSLVGYPTMTNIKTKSDGTPSNRAEFENALVDFLCPVNPKTNLWAECRGKLRESVLTGNQVYSPFNGNALECDLKSCNVKLVCKLDTNGTAIPGTCNLEAPQNNSPKAIAQEYQRYLTGFDLLNR
jgi:hypothetical protein